MLLVVLSGCGGGGGGSSSGASRITVTGTIYKNDSGTPLTAADFNGGYIKIEALTAGGKGLNSMADVDTVTLSTNGNFTLRYIPTDRRTVLRIEYYKNKTLTFYGWYLFDGSKDNRTLAIYPGDLAAHRLAFDLVRSYVDFKLEKHVYGNYYRQIVETVRSGLTGDLSSWMANSSTFLEYLQGKINPATHTSALKAIVECSAENKDVDARNDEIIDEVPDDHVDDYKTVRDKYLVADNKLLNIMHVEARVENNELVIEVDRNKNGMNLDLVLYDSSLSPSSQQVISFGNDTKIRVPYAQLPGNTFYLQVIAHDTANWYSSNYASIDYDRTPCVRLNVP